MSRLIDADALKTDLTRFYDNEVTAKRLIDEQPTIDAIPVEWIEWQIMNAKYNGIKEAADAFEFVLNCYKEQEAQEG